MRLLNSMSSRFVRSLNYSMPEYRPSMPRGVKTRISVVSPADPIRTTVSGKGPTSDVR